MPRAIVADKKQDWAPQWPYYILAEGTRLLGDDGMSLHLVIQGPANHSSES